MHDPKALVHDLSNRLKGFLDTFDLSQKEVRVKELERQSSQPNFWDNQDNARTIMQELGDLQKELGEIKDLKEQIEILEALSENDLAENPEELQKTKTAIERLEVRAYLSGIYDKKSAIVGIHAGQGGTEAMDWASMLFRMYLRFAEKRGWKTEVIDATYGEEAGIKSVVFKIEGTFTFGFMKGEAGTHRLVRQSPFNADSLRQTSFALVEVMPELEELDLPDINIRDDELEIQFFRSGGHGGQNVNKVSTAVRIKHVPSGVVVTAQTERFQEQNRKIAMNLLRAKLWIRQQELSKVAKKELKGEYRPASWGTQIRSYVLHPYKMIKDLRTEVETGNTEAVLAGDLDEFIDAELKLLR